LPLLFVENIFFRKHDFFVEAPKDQKIKVAIFQSFETNYAMIEHFLNPPDPQVAMYLFILLPFLFVENIFFQKHDFFVEAPKV